MFLELAEVLDCPDCRASAGLVAFVDRAERQRVIEGRLGCPLCEIEVPIRRGTMRFDLSGAARRASGAGSADPARPGPPLPGPPLPGPAAETALRIAALLGVTDRAGQVVLLGPGLAGHAGRLARMGDRLEVVVWLDARGDPAAPGVADLEAGVDPLLGAAPGGWPVRSGALHGVALTGPLALDLTEIERCVRPGARLFVAEPTSEDLEALSESGFGELAADPTAWVGERR
ncbi:hypothetical protein [Candidatus Palauibacter sp.]|uniref:hypothetical protein n=1 Tax=Candidatus Palauibacter sp. TaxID=3101350 RepID=UPI003AF210CE